MDSRLRSAIAPAYLLACLILGGSAQGIWQNMVLQLAGVAILAWTAIDRSEEPLTRAARHLLILAAATVAIVLVQLVPMPPALWTHLGPRAAIATGFGTLGMKLPAEPLSLTPAASLSALLVMIPPIAMFCAMVRSRAYRPRWLAIALLAATTAGVALGALQVASNAQLSPWYLYAETSNGRAVGFFANADHMATLLVMAIPFVAALVAAARSSSMQRYSAVIAIVVGIGFVIVIGLALNGSLAGYGLALPVIAASLLVLLPATSRLRVWIVGAAVLLVIAATVAVETTAIGSGTIGDHATTSVQSRAELVSTTAHAAADFMPFGSGLGSFETVYHLYEKPEQVTNTFVVHAHNDFLEVALELGLAGIVVMLLFLGWWAMAVGRTWRTAEAGPFARAAAVASAAALVHALVDFPLRTAAIAATFAVCMALLADKRAAPPKEKAELRRKRHVEFK